MEKELVSIIIPAYNAEHHISRCLESILGQTYQNLEILVIDDGSTDGTYSIVKGISYRDNRVKVFTQKNAGVSAARNLGVDNAQGKYMTFVDADDYVREDFIEKMAEHIEHYDLVICGYNLMRNKIVPMLLDKSRRLTKREFFKLMFCSKLITGACWNKLFYTNIVHNNQIRFPVQFIVNEDRVFCMLYYQYCKKVFYVSEPLYQYWYNEKSCTHLKYQNKIFDIKQVAFLDSMELIENMYQNESEYVRACINSKKVRYCVNLMFQMVACGNYEKMVAHRIRKIIRDEYNKYASYKLIYGFFRLAVRCIYVSPKLTYVIGRFVFILLKKQIEKYLD